MKLIRSGGVNARLSKTDSDYAKYGFGNYFMLQVKAELDALILQGKPVAICTAAKQNRDDYHRWLADLGFHMNNFTVLGREDGANWEQYAAVLMLGGETKELYAWLQRTGFSLAALRNCSLLGGDSAGAYVLSAKTLIDYTPDGKSFEIVDGFLPGLRQLVAAHVNNTYYHQPSLTKALNEWCRANRVAYLGLAENEVDVREI